MLDTLSDDDKRLLLAALSTTWLPLLANTPGQAEVWRLMVRIENAKTIVLNNEVNPVAEQ